MRLKAGVDGDCARGDDDSEAFAMRSEDRTSEQFLGVTQLCQAHNVISWVRNQSLPLGATSQALEPITAAEAPPPSMNRRSAAPFGSLATRRLSGTGPRNHASLPFTVGLFPPTAFLHAFPSSFPMALDQKPAEFQLTRVCDSLSPNSPHVPFPHPDKPSNPARRPTAWILPDAGPVPDLDAHMFRRSTHPLIVSAQSISHRADLDTAVPITSWQSFIVFLFPMLIEILMSTDGS